MEAPSWFTKELERTFGGRLRVRWSPSTQTFHVEEKVGRAALPARRGTEHSDAWVRARDGYNFVLAISTGDRKPCPSCGRTLYLPIREFKETPCPDCSAKVGRPMTLKAVYWPLGSSLLEHLAKIDPLTDGHRRMVAEADAFNQAREKSQDRVLGNHIESATKDLISYAGGFSPVGYTGKEQPIAA